MKKLFFGLGTIVSVTAPILTAVSCSELTALQQEGMRMVNEGNKLTKGMEDRFDDAIDNWDKERLVIKPAKEFRDEMTVVWHKLIPVAPKDVEADEVKMYNFLKETFGTAYADKWKELQALKDLENKEIARGVIEKQLIILLKKKFPIGGLLMEAITNLQNKIVYLEGQYDKEDDK